MPSNKQKPNKQAIQKLLNDAQAFFQQGRLPESERLIRQLLSISPSNPAGLELLGMIAHRANNHSAAVSVFTELARVDKKNARPHYFLGVVYSEQGENDKAIASYQRAIMLDRKMLPAHNNLGLLLKKLERFEEAIAAFDHCVKLDPRSAYALSNLGNVYKDAGYMAEAVKYLKQAVAADKELAAAHSNLLMALNYQSDVTPEEVCEEHKRWPSHVPRVISPNRFSFDGRESFGTENRKIRIAYLSPDLRTHSVAFFLLPLLKNHDKERFEIYGLYNNVVSDSTTESLRSLCDHWKNVFEMSELELAQWIFDQKIDVLVDLAGHTAHNRLAVLYQKPAPVQMTWLGYPNTTGMDQIDYRVCDELTDPHPSSDCVNTERLLRLPSGFLCYSPVPSAPEVSSLPLLANKSLTFGSFNNLVKMTDEVIEVWADILKAVAGSRLLLKSQQLGNPMTRDRVIAKFEALSISSDRLLLHAQVPDQAAHLALYNEVDIALDPFPYNGTTTSFEALWMGVPVLCRDGDRHAARVSASIMKRLGLHSFVVERSEDFVPTALALSNDIESLSELRAGLREKLKESSLCDGQNFAREFESALMNAAESSIQ